MALFSSIIVIYDALIVIFDTENQDFGPFVRKTREKECVSGSYSVTGGPDAHALATDGCNEYLGNSRH